MSTACLIGYKIGQTVDAIYCHYDGGPNYVGRILKKYYKDESKVDDLISLGSISCLGSELGKQVDMNEYTSMQAIYTRAVNNEDMQTVAYHRDRGDPLTIKMFKSVQAYLNNDTFVDFLYLYSNGSWYYCCTGDKEFKKL